MPNRNQTPTGNGAFALPDVFVREEACHLPQIDHLSIVQLRRRAAENREDALRMNRLDSIGCLAMLLSDAERCEARAEALETVVRERDGAMYAQAPRSEASRADIRPPAAHGVGGNEPGGETGPTSSLPPQIGSLLRSDATATAKRGREALARLVRLSAREIDVLGLLALGKTSKLIAYELNISAKTVEIHRARIMVKMGCGSLVELGRLWEAAVGALPPSLAITAPEGDRLA